MVPRRTRAREAQLAFEALSIEGGLLAPEWLARVAQLEAGGQGEGDYRVAKGLLLRDEIGRYWRVAQAHWKELRAGLTAKGDPAALAGRFADGFLREVLGFASLVTSAPVVLGERTLPVGRIALDGRVPVVVAPAGMELDDSSPAFGDGGRRRSAFGLAQEYLNAKDDAVWGIATNVHTLRILRDNSSLTRPAWIEADLARIFDEELYADFAALWLLAHETRFGSADRPATDCPLETWRATGREEGTRARDKLRKGVEDALLELGNGFLSHPENGALRAALREGKLSAAGYFQELLRLVYRVIFLLAVEERGLLHPEGTQETARKLYAEGYGLRRLRDRAVRRNAHDRFSDLWESLKIVFRSLARGEPRLALPALGGLFDVVECPHLDAAKLQNRALLTAMFRLAWLHGKSGLERVNWRDMGPEELGSVYEGLLELVPQLVEGGHAFAFAAGGEAKGNARKLTGSYYTPESLVQLFIESALEPVVKEALAAHPENGAEALLRLAIVDPACGSGHFLLAAADRLAAHVARLRANGTASPAQRRAALRQVVSRCIFGVDLNPLAVELCRVSLWMEAVEPGRPLTFLNSHVQCGNALLGATPELLAKGVPDVAWQPIEGDNKETASYLKKRNTLAAEGQRAISFARDREDEAAVVAGAVKALDAAPDASIEEVARKELSWEELQGSPAYRHQKFVADALCAAFMWPKPKLEAKPGSKGFLPSPIVEAAPTNDMWLQLRDGRAAPSRLTSETVEALAAEHRFLHWHLAFPQVFAKGGFEVVLGNPPWDSLLFHEEEFFAARSPEIAQATTAAARKRMIAKLEVDNPELFSEYSRGLRAVEGASVFVRSGETYPLCGVGRVNLYALFAEAASRLVSRRGRIGQLLPSGIVTDDSTKLFFQAAVEQGRLVSFFDFENREGIFPAVHRSYKFGVLTLSGAPRPAAASEFVFFALRVEHLKDAERRFSLSAADIALLNPATKTCPIFRSRRDAEITKAVYRLLPVLTSAGWGLEMRRLLNSADDSGHFATQASARTVQLYEGKYFHQFDHRWMSNEDGEDRELSDVERADPARSIKTRFWYPRDEILERFGKDCRWSWVLATRKIVRSTDERTFIATVIPSLAVSDSAKVLVGSAEYVQMIPALIGTLCAFVFDFVARQKLGGANMSGYVAEQLPILPVTRMSAPPPWSPKTPLGAWIGRRVLELTYTAWDLAQFARDVGYDGPPFRWDPERRFHLRAELDAAFFHLYGISRDDSDYILETFPIVKKNDEKAHSVYRTKRVILEIYDAIAEAIRTGRPYESRLDPPPADPRVAHPPRAPEPPPQGGSRERRPQKAKA